MLRVADAATAVVGFGGGGGGARSSTMASKGKVAIIGSGIVGRCWTAVGGWVVHVGVYGCLLLGEGVVVPTFHHPWYVQRPWRNSPQRTRHVHSMACFSSSAHRTEPWQIFLAVVYSPCPWGILTRLSEVPISRYTSLSPLPAFPTFSASSLPPHPM